MKKEWKIILEIVVLVGGLYGLRQNNLISTEIAITIGIIITYLIFCFQNFRQELNDELTPIKNALAEIQKFLRESFDFSPLHKVAPANKYVPIYPAFPINIFSKVSPVKSSLGVPSAATLPLSRT